MPVRYADIVKRDEKQGEQQESDGVKPDVKKPVEDRKGGNYNYNVWEYAYFPYLVEMYKLLYDEWTAKDMSDFCQFIYRVSSGKISPYLNDMTKEEEELYFAYIIKRNNF